MKTPKEHIEEIRRDKFSIGGPPNRVMPDLQQAVRFLSTELYSKDVHFLMELVQNAEDNQYPSGVQPSLEFIITTKDITTTGVTSTLLIFNNENGFSKKNIESICSVGLSTKKGNRQNGYIGEKGIGFKSVFLITSQPYIFSNGYQIRFNEEPHPECKLGYIVPEWVEENPTLSDINLIYGSGRSLPTTILVLPLKSEKVAAVKQKLSNVHPEVLLFLSKIKRLSIREDKGDHTVSAISISSDTGFQIRKDNDAESYIVYLKTEENHLKEGNEFGYRMWRQRFPVRQDNRTERRMEVEEWVITLAFPLERRGMNSPGIYAFLPTEMVTDFPFIIQADFILATSRETLLMDDKWNKGILDCIPAAFIRAFVSLVKETESLPSSLPLMFKFLPVEESRYPVLNVVRNSIRSEVTSKNIMPCESYTQQKIFRKPDEVGRLIPAFWGILLEARKQKVCLRNLHGHGHFILDSAFDSSEYDGILEFLGVKPVDSEWYCNCIQSTNLIWDVTEDVYMQLLCFFADNWDIHFKNTSIKKKSVLKYVGPDGKLALSSIDNMNQPSGSRLCFASNPRHISWLINWNWQFRCAARQYFLPKLTQECLNTFYRSTTVKEWLRNWAVDVTVYDYSVLLAKALQNDKNLIISFTHFLYRSLEKDYLSKKEVAYLCDSMPLVNHCGQVTTRRRMVLVPASESKWASLLESNPWIDEDFIELAEDYLRPGHYAGLPSGRNLLMNFLVEYVKASDVPDLYPPNAEFHSVSSPLNVENTFLLLEWIRHLKYKGLPIPNDFLRCIKEGSWMKTSVGYKPPSESFLPSSEWGSLLQMGSLQIAIPLIDQDFYHNNISCYKEELKTIGVMFEHGEACHYVGKCLMRLAADTRLPKIHVYSLLNFIRFLREKYFRVEDFINSVKGGRWLKTTHGDRSPVTSVLDDLEWKVVLEISNPPLIDKNYYGEEILMYRTELALLGVEVSFDQNYQLVEDNLRLPSSFESLSAQSTLLLLGCIQHSTSRRQLAVKLKNRRWLRTNLGYRFPSECFLSNSEWGSLLKIFSDTPYIDENFYGSAVRSYVDELKEVGVITTLEAASKAVISRFKDHVSPYSITRENVFSLLACFRDFNKLNRPLPAEFHRCICDEKWLRTRRGYKSPRESILLDEKWESILPIMSLPFIDDTKDAYGIHIYEYRDVLKQIGVTIRLEDGLDSFERGLHIRNPSDVTPLVALKLLECVRDMLKRNSLCGDFKSRINKKWLKTVMGFRCPSESMLFDPSWGSLHRDDGPFIDEAYHGLEISSYRNELQAIGVVVDVQKGCPLLASNLLCHSNFDKICRIYACLNRCNWEPENKTANWIWIPQETDNEKWVSPQACILHDKDNLFSSKYHVLDKLYKKEILSYFSVLGVQANPSIDDYLELWSEWEKASCQLTFSECCAFWVCVSKHWSEKTKHRLSNCIVKLPVSMRSGGILLANKKDVFIPNDLQLRDLFEDAYPELFLWYPQVSLPSISRSKLNEIYSCIGIRTISESVDRDESPETNGLRAMVVDRGSVMIKHGLFKILLGFLADPSLEFPSNVRHSMTKQIIDIHCFEVEEPITVHYGLPLSSGDKLCVKANRMIRWDRENSTVFFQKFDRSIGYKASIEFATHFSEVISKGLLWNHPDHIDRLSELIKLGFLLEFDDGAVDFLLKTKNLQLFAEDEEFLSSVLCYHHPIAE